MGRRRRPADPRSRQIQIQHEPVFVEAGVVLEVPAEEDLVRGSEDSVEVHCRPVDDVEVGPNRHAVVGVVNANLWAWSEGSHEEK